MAAELRCRRCASTVAANDDWKRVDQSVYHKNCFNCDDCTARIVGAGVHVRRDGRLACKGCRDNAAVLKAVEASRAGRRAGIDDSDCLFACKPVERRPSDYLLPSLNSATLASDAASARLRNFLQQRP